MSWKVHDNGNYGSMNQDKMDQHKMDHQTVRNWQIKMYPNRQEEDINNEIIKKDTAPLMAYVSSSSIASLTIQTKLVEELGAFIKMDEPWIGIKNKPLAERMSNPNLRFLLIKLPISRNPFWYLMYILFPLFLIASAGFSVYAIPLKDTSDRLSVLLTVLLTFTVFQNMISDELPRTCEVTMIDLYILFTYGIQAVMILSVSFHVNDYLGRWYCGVWILISALYIIGGSLWYYLSEHCCTNWKQRFFESKETEEIKQWESELNKFNGRYQWRNA